MSQEPQPQTSLTVGGVDILRPEHYDEKDVRYARYLLQSRPFSSAEIGDERQMRHTLLSVAVFEYDMPVADVLAIMADL